MSGANTRYFFQQVRLQSQIKHRVLQTYLVPWSEAVLSTHSRAWVIDAFAGPGRYESGDPGSPEIALKQAQSLANKNPPKRLQCIFAETKERYRKKLRQVAADYPNNYPLLIEDDFWSRATQIPEIVHEDPVLLFVDPYGLAGINFDVLATLCAKLPTVDILVNLRTPAAARLSSRWSDRISKAVGSDDWSAEKLHELGELFRRNLGEAVNVLSPASLMVRERLGGGLKTELILASRHPKAYQLWNDQMVIEVERLYVTAGEIPPPRHSKMPEVRQRLLEITSSWTSWTKRDLLDWHVVQYCGDVHTGTVRRAIDDLLRQQVWTPAGRRPSDIDKLTWGQRRPLFP